MKYAALVLVLIIGGLFLLPRFKVQEKKTTSSVTVEVLPRDPAFSGQLWKFDITLDTHSGDLNQDLVKIAALKDNRGNIYRAVSWEGDPPGGHHRQGILSFQSIDPKPQKIILQIETKKFEWKPEGGEKL